MIHSPVCTAPAPRVPALTHRPLTQVFLFALIDSAEDGLDAEDCNGAAAKDWLVDSGHDSGGAGSLSRQAFESSWFQMADLNVTYNHLRARARYARAVAVELVGAIG